MYRCCIARTVGTSEAAGAGESDEPDALDAPGAGAEAVRGGVLRTAGYALTLGLGLVSVPLMTAHLGVVQFGYYVTASALVLIVSSVTDGGLTAVGTRDYAAARPSDRPIFLERLLGLRMVLAASGAGLTVLVAWVGALPGPVVTGAGLGGAGIFLLTLQQTYTIPLVASLRFGWVTTLDLSRQFILTSLLIFSALAGLGLTWFFVANVVAGLLTLCATMMVVGRLDRIALPAFDRGRAVAILRDVAPYALATAAGTIYFRLGVVLLGYVTDDREVGYFSTAFRVVEILTIAPAILVTTAFPILARAAVTDGARLRHGAGRVFEVFAVLGALAAALMIVGARPAIDVVAPLDTFGPSVDVFRVEALAIAFTFMAAALSFVLLAVGQTRAVLRANLAALVVAVVGTLGLGAAAGAQGAAIAAVLAEATLAASLAWGVRSALPGTVSAGPVLAKVLTVAGTAGACGLLAPVAPVAQTAVTAVAFAAGASIAGLIPAELRDALRRRVAS